MESDCRTTRESNALVNLVMSLYARTKDDLVCDRVREARNDVCVLVARYGDDREDEDAEASP